MKSNKKSTKKWLGGMLGITLALLVAQGSVIAAVDPYFHYHKPLKNLYYELTN